MHLATTSIEEYWNKDTKILFLGEWCKLYDREDLLGQLEHETLGYVWDGVDSLESAIIYCNDVYESILASLVDILNRYHSTNHDKHYWRVLLSSWLLPFIHVLYDKYHHLAKARQDHGDLQAYTMCEDMYYTPDNFTSYSEMIASNEWYHLQLYSQIIKFLGIDYSDIKSDGFPKKHSRRKILASYKDLPLRLITTLLNKLLQNKSIIVTQPYFKKYPLFNVLRLLLKSRFVLVFNNMAYDIKISNNININDRKKIFNGGGGEFEQLLYNMFVYNMPKIFLEGYRQFSSDVNALKIRIPDFIMSSNAIHGNDVFKFFVANSGAKILYKQHGGGYGIEDLSVNEKIEREISSVFYTNGWKDNDTTIPISSQNLTIKKTVSSDKINLVMTSMPRYVYRLQFAEDSTKMLQYIENAQRFISILSKRDSLVIRPYGVDYGWKIKDRLVLKFNGLVFDRLTDYYSQMSSSRINVFDHMHTGYLDSLSMNKPTVIFICKDMYSFRSSSKLYIDKLKSIKILFDDPAEAAEHINTIYDDVDSWWFSDEVQKAREEFCYNYARTSDDWADEWIEEFRRVLREDDGR